MQFQFLSDPNFWSIWASIATVLGFIVVSYAAIVALGQLREMTKTRHLEAMLHVYEMIGSNEARKQRRFIYTELKSTPENPSDEEREIIEQVTVTFDRVGRLVESGLIPKNELLEGHSAIIIKAWSKLEPYISYQRKIIGKRHAHNFERLVQIAQDYDSKHYPEDSPRIVEVPIPTNKSKQTNGV